MKNVSPFTVIYADEQIIAVNKAAGISVGGDRWDESKERLDRLVAEQMQPASKLFTVHRIDRETSGLVVFAKDEQTHRRLSLAFEGRDVTKRYIAVVHGRPLWQETSCDLPLIPNGNKRHLTIIDKYQGKKSQTHFRLLGSAGNYSVLEALPETGRTHQIRVHATALGYPIVCDTLYGTDKLVITSTTPHERRSESNTPQRGVLLSAIKKNWRGDPFDEKPLLSRLGLHAAELSLPVEDGELQLYAPLPRDMNALIKQMGIALSTLTY